MKSFHVKNVRAICFDVDSTVCTNDGLDALGQYMGKAQLIADITNKAMNGVLDLPIALDQRLDALKLTKTNIESFKQRVSISLTPGIRRLINALQASKIKVYLVSGGIYEMVERVAKELNVPEANVYVNRLIYSEDGRCIGFDPSQPTSRSDGKMAVIAELKAKLPAGSGVLMVGDGMTDAAAAPPADAFIGFGGNVARPAVQRATPYYFYSFDDMYAFFQDNGIIRQLD
uniref:Phosphoserine phosphatase n=1 Tax=Schistocephalus solidus TaxID=70667 RepID=A0A0X3PZ50_SCHSO